MSKPSVPFDSMPRTPTHTSTPPTQRGRRQFQRLQLCHTSMNIQTTFLPAINKIGDRLSVANAQSL